MEDEVESLRRALAREQEKIRALQDIGAALGSTLDLNELLALVIERVSELMNADRSTLYLLDENTGELWSKVMQGEGQPEIRLKVGEGLAGAVAATGRSINIADAYDDERFDRGWDERSGYRTKSMLCVPMKNQHGRTIGVIQCLNKGDGESFSDEDEALLTALSSQAAVSIENSKLFLSVVGKNMELLDTKEQLERKVHDQDVLFEIAQVAASAAALDELLSGVLARTTEAIGAEAASILLADDHTGELRFRAAVGGQPDAVKRVRIGAGQGICGWVATHGKPQMVNDVGADPRHSVEISDQVGYHPRSVLCVPLAFEGGFGALELLNKQGGRRPFTNDDVKLAMMIAGHVSTAIERAQAKEQREHENRLSAIGQFLSSVLHDLKTPMTVIGGYTQLLVEEDDGAERKQYAQLIRRQVELINAMTRETLAYARGDRKLWVRKIYLHTFFEEIVTQLRREMAERGVAVELTLKDRGVAYLDAHKVQRAVHNLVRNAAEAIQSKRKPGGTSPGELLTPERVKRQMAHEGSDAAPTTRLGTVRLVVSRTDEDAIVLQVEDDGPGIPEAIREQLFAPFATHGKAEGTGLGLAVVRSIVDEHEGEISVESKPGHTAFTLVFPQRDRASMPPARTASAR